MVCTLRSQFTDGSVNDWRIFVRFTERSELGQDNVILFFFVYVSNQEKCKKSNMIFEPHIKIRSRAIFERQTTVVPKADGFLFFRK